MTLYLRQTLTTGLLGLLLAGCTLGPNYVKPDAPVPLSFKEGAPWTEAAPQDQLAKGPWWELYGDPVLNKLQSRAAAANQQLKGAVARLDQARALARVSKADLTPRLDLRPTAQRGRFTAEQSGVAGGLTANNVSLPLDLSYEVDLWGRVRRSIEAATADYQASAADFETVRLTLHAELARNYFALHALDAEIALLERSIELRREALFLVQTRFANGVVSQLDVARAETELATTEAEAIGLNKSRGELEHALAVLLGESPSRFNLAAAPLELQPLNVAPDLPSQLLERRPDVAAAERQMAAANARIGVAKTAFFPAIRLTGSAGYQRGEIASLFDWSSRSWALGPAISLPIFDGGRNSANLDRAKSAHEQAIANYRQQVLVAFQEVEDGLLGLRVLGDQAGVQERAVQAAQKAAELSDKRYRAGMVSYLEVVDSQRTALQTERSAVQILSQRLQTSVLLIKALGGGWNERLGSDRG